MSDNIGTPDIFGESYTERSISGWRKTVTSGTLSLSCAILAPKAKPAVKAVAPVRIETPKSKSYIDQSLLSIVMTQLEDAKAEDIIAINLDGKTAIADNMVVASGRSNRHVGAIADQLVEKLKEAGHRHIRVEGMDQCDWVLVDAVDVVVHLFRPEVRSFYNLEKLWSEHSPQEPLAG